MEEQLYTRKQTEKLHCGAETMFRSFKKKLNSKFIEKTHQKSNFQTGSSTLNREETNNSKWGFILFDEEKFIPSRWIR